MVILIGILKYSIGGFLFFRDFANYLTLINISKENSDVQRSLYMNIRQNLLREDDIEDSIIKHGLK